MPTSHGRAEAWQPKAFRPESTPTHQEISELVQQLKGHASGTTFELFHSLARTPLGRRVADAACQTVRHLERAPLANNVLRQLLTLDQYTSLQELTLLQLSQKQRHTANQLLCLRERELVASFFRLAFRETAKHNENHLHDMELL